MLRNENNSNNIMNEPNMTSKILLTDDNVSLYIEALFSISPRASTGTAPASEWFEFLELYNTKEGHYILTQQQMDSIRPYCKVNQDVEMTPQDFIRLVLIIRHREDEITPQMSVSSSANNSNTKKLFDSRPRSSRLISKKSASNYYEDRASTNHPDDSDDHDLSLNNNNDHRPRKRADYNNDYSATSSNTNPAAAASTADISMTDDSSSSNIRVKTLQKEKNIATRQLKEYENRISIMSKEHSDRISQLKTRLEYMTIDADQQKALLIQQKNKERERLDKIAELQTIIDDSDSKNDIVLKKQQKKVEEVEKVKEQLFSLNETFDLTQGKLKDLEIELFRAKETIRVLEKEKVDLHAEIDGEKQLLCDTKNDLNQQQDENTKLLEIIDKQKFDLDEARSGLRIYSNSPALDKKANESLSFAQEQIEAEYQKKLLEKNQSIAKLENSQKEFNNITNKQASIISTLSSRLEKQDELIVAIKSSITVPDSHFFVQTKFHIAFTSIAWVFLLYHIFALMFALLYNVSDSKTYGIEPALWVIQIIDETLYPYYKHY